MNAFDAARVFPAMGDDKGPAVHPSGGPLRPYAYSTPGMAEGAGAGAFSRVAEGVSICR